MSDAVLDAGTNDMQGMSLDALKRLERGGDAKTRQAASHELAARATRGAATAKTVALRIEHSEFGTAQPALILTASAGCPARDLRASVFELAARVERALLATHELWSVHTRVDSAVQATVYLELMDGSTLETQRASALLTTAIPSGGVMEGVAPAGPRKRGRKPKGHAQLAPEPAPEPAPSEPEAEADTEPAALDAPDCREARQRWYAAAGDKQRAKRLERRVLDEVRGRRRDAAPCAIAVAKGAQPDAAYYTWLIEQTADQVAAE